MKRLLLAIVPVGVVLAVAFALRPGSSAGQTPACCASAPACCAEAACKGKSCCQTAGRAKSNTEVVAELVAILDRTKNADTYLATLLALSQFEDKSPLPAVVRNAARLGLLKGLTKAEKPSHAQEMIGAYLSGEMTLASQVANRGQYAPTVPGYPAAYPMTMPSPYTYPPACIGGPPSVGYSVPTPPCAPPASGYKSESVGMPVPCSPPTTTPPSGTSDKPMACPVECHVPPMSAAPVNESNQDRAQIFSFWQGFSR